MQTEEIFKVGIGSTPAAAVTEEKESERVRKGDLAKRRSLRPSPHRGGGPTMKNSMKIPIDLGWNIW